MSCASAEAQRRVSRVPGDMKHKSSCSSSSGKLPAIHRDSKPMCACPCSEGCPWDCCRDTPTVEPCRPLLLSRAAGSCAACGVERGDNLPVAWAGVRSPGGEQVPAEGWKAALITSAGQWWNLCSTLWGIIWLERDGLQHVADRSRHKPLCAGMSPAGDISFQRNCFLKGSISFGCCSSTASAKSLWLRFGRRKKP